MMKIHKLFGTTFRFTFWTCLWSGVLGLASVNCFASIWWIYLFGSISLCCMA